MVATGREMLDLVAGANPPVHVLAEITGHFEAVQTALRDHQVREQHRPFGHVDAPGRGQFMSPRVNITCLDRASASATVTFGTYFLGGNGAAHGGTIPLMFAELLGPFAGTDRTPCRTVYLHVDYRAITPIGVELAVTAWFEREEGRKRFLRAELRHGDVVCAACEALFIELRPGQP
ncbi:PaaI family thioesterase [Rhodococcus opacus]|nr:PaaI family thioesterase [Rhodococcus opacus]